MACMQNYPFPHFSQGETSKDHIPVNVQFVTMLLYTTCIVILQDSPIHQVDDVALMHQ